MTTDKGMEMKKYAVYGVMTGSKFLGEFEANSPEEAQEMAANSEENSVCLCHQCSDEIELNDFAFQEFQVEAR